LSALQATIQPDCISTPDARICDYLPIVRAHLGP
jgi:hypothetical protein